MVQHQILYQPSYSLLVVQLSPNEEMNAETGAMVSKTPNVEIETSMKGGLFGALKRSVLGGESFFVNKFRSVDGPGEVTFAPDLPGDIMHHPINGTIFVQSGSYICGSASLEVDTKWGGARGFFSGEGLFLLKVTGRGDLFLSSYGAIHVVQLAAGQKYIVDTGHMVAFDESVTYTVQKAGGWKTTLLGGEGLVCEYSGPGKVYLQTRSEGAFLQWLIPKLPKPGN